MNSENQCYGYGALQAIDTSAEFREFTGTTTDSDVFTVSTDGDKVAGSYEINVVSLAKAQINTVDIDYTNSSGDDLFTVITMERETGLTVVHRPHYLIRESQEVLASRWFNVYR